MNVKVMALIFMVAFAVAATPIVISLSNSQIAEGNVGFTESHNTMQMDDEVSVELLGEIDTPGMPG